MRNVKVYGERFILFACISIIIIFIYSVYYSYTRIQALSDVRSCVKGMLHQEMNTRLQVILLNEQIYSDGKKPKLKPYPFYVSITTEQGEERFLIDSLSSMKNIASTSSERAFYSTSLRENPFKLDSFRIACIDSLSQKGLFVRLFFDFRDRKVHATSGDSFSSLLVMDCNLGYGNEYTLKAYAHIPFLFSRNIRLGLVLVILLVTGGGIYCYRGRFNLKRKLIKSKQKETVSGEIHYVRASHTFYIPKTATSVCLTFREAEIFEALYFAPAHTVSSSDLKMKLFGDSSIQTSALATRLGDIRKKLREVGDFRIEYNKTTRCYTLFFTAELCFQ